MSARRQLVRSLGVVFARSPRPKPKSREFECDLHPRFESATCIEPVPPPYPRKSTPFIGSERHFGGTDSTLISSSSVCKSAAYCTDSPLMRTCTLAETDESIVRIGA